MEHDIAFLAVLLEHFLDLLLPVGQLPRILVCAVVEQILVGL